MKTKFKILPKAITKIALSRSLGAILLTLCLSNFAKAEQNDQCPSTAANADFAHHWNGVLDENEWMHRAVLSMDDSSAPPLDFWIEVDGPVDVVILDLFFPPIYDGRIGVLHYYSGAAGTHAMVEFTRIAVVDTLTGNLITNPMYSTSLSGARYVEQGDGTTIGQNYYYCELTKIEWLPDRFLVNVDDEQSVYMLPESRLY